MRRNTKNQVAPTGRGCGLSARACGPGAARATPRPTSLTEVVEIYRHDFAGDAEVELAFYAGMPSTDAAIGAAAMAQRADGKRHGHQTRLPTSVLKDVHVELGRVAAELESAADFDALFTVVEQAIGSLPGVGELMVYDTALRLGAYFRRLPGSVYLHRGVRVGARALGIAPHRTKVEVDELPAPLRQLRPYELEDCLCLFKDDLGRLASGQKEERSTR